MGGADVAFVANGQFVPALGATARKHITAVLGFHTLAKTMGLCPFAIIWLKSTFRHYRSLLGDLVEDWDGRML
jgi:hypothetical protein